MLGTMASRLQLNLIGEAELLMVRTESGSTELRGMRGSDRVAAAVHTYGPQFFHPA